MPYKALKKDPSAPDKRKRKGRKSTVKNSTTAPRKILITAKFKQRAEEAVGYRMMGYTFVQIGDAMKVDPAYANRLVQWSLDREPVQGADQLRARMSSQLEMMMSATLENAFAGDSEAQDQSRKTMELYAKLNALYAPPPVRVEHTGEDGGPITFVIRPEDANL